MEGLKEGEDVREGGREEPSQGEGPTEAEHQASEEDGVPFGAGEKGGREGGREGGRSGVFLLGWCGRGRGLCQRNGSCS